MPDQGFFSAGSCRIAYAAPLFSDLPPHVSDPAAKFMDPGTYTYHRRAFAVAADGNVGQIILRITCLLNYFAPKGGQKLKHTKCRTLQAKILKFSELIKHLTPLTIGGDPSQHLHLSHTPLALAAASCYRREYSLLQQL
jgi:hypothetical protein